MRSRLLHSALSSLALSGAPASRSSLRFVSASVALPPPSVAERRSDIVAPPLDERSYRWIKVSNGLQALLVHDPEADKAAAALEVRAGHFSDPADVPGLAHFTEHMCFLGTEKEPSEDAFKAFLQRHGGSSNAFTGMEATGYHFQVGPDVLPAALERFAAFFSCPLFREDSARREMEAVDSEFRRNLQSDVRRLFQLTKATSSAAHPFSKFSTGNLQTLSRTAVGSGKPHEAVRAFYERHYLAQQMQLCVLGRESLEELEAAVVRCFSELRTEAPPASDDRLPSVLPPGVAAAAPAGRPFADAQRGALLRTTPVREMRLLRLMWELPPEREFLRSKTVRVLSSLAQHEGEGSLSWLLTQRLDPPLATSVSCSSLYSLSDATIFGFSLTLTPEGLRRYEEVAEIVYGFLGGLARSVGAGGAAADAAEAGGAGDGAGDGAGGGGAGAALPAHILSERAMMSKLAFDFAEPSEPLALVKALAGRMHLLPPDQLLSNAYEWPDALDAAELGAVLRRLTPDEMCMLLVDPTEIDEGARRLEEWYQTPYELTKLPAAMLARLRDARPHPELALFPPENPYVPDDVSLLPPEPPTPEGEPTRGGGGRAAAAAAAARAPRNLTPAADEAARGVRAWHLDAGAFARPRASVIALVRSPLVAAGGARAAVLSQLGADLLSDQLTTELAPCGLAGLGWSVGAHQGGLLLQASGYSQRLPKLATDLAEAAAAFAPDPARFEVVREVLERSLRNKRQERPLWHAQSAVSRALGAPSYHYEDALAFVADAAACTPDAVAEHVRGLLGASFIELFVHGNLRPADATRLASDCRELLGGAPLAADCAPLAGFELVEPSPVGAARTLSTVARNADEANSAIEAHFQWGELPLREEALLLLLAQVASKAAFHRLRTELQLGYVVQCGVRSVNRCRGLSVLIQSAVADPPTLDGHIEEWLRQFRATTLAELSQAELDEYKTAVAATLEEPPKTLHQEASSLWPEILEGTHRWRHMLDLAATLRDLELAELLAAFDERVAAGGAARRKVASYCYSPKDAQARDHVDVELP